MRVAALDLGTNTTLCAVVEKGDGGAVRVVGDRAIITGLGRGATPSLQPERVAATLRAIEELAAWARGLGASRLAAVGTSAVRDAPNREELLRPARAILGEAWAIAGSEEAALTYAGATVGLSHPPADPTVVDVGGGSTEIVRRDGDALVAVSLDVGAVRLTERHLRHDPPTDGEIAALLEDVERALGSARSILRAPLLLLAGSATNLGACALGVPVERWQEVVGRTVTATEIETTARRIAATPIGERLALGGIEAGREATIAAGGLLLSSIVRRAGGADAMIGDGGVRFGLAMEMLSG